MKSSLILCLAAATILAGCGGDSSKPAGNQPSANSSSPADAPAGYLGAAVKAQQAAVKTVDTTSLQKAIQMFNVDEGRYPKDLNELVDKKYMPKIPDVPVGTKLAYDSQAGTVKVVPK